MDPISWYGFKAKLQDWADIVGSRVVIPDLANSLFLERSLPTHQGRLPPHRSVPKAQVYSLLETPSQLGWKFANIHATIPSKTINLRNKINLFDSTLLMLGVLPNQLRSIAKEYKMEHTDDFFTRFSDTLFWEGYEIWKKRVRLVKCFWKTIAPSDWKKNHKDSKSRGKRTLRPNCKNPFHYCKKISDLSMQRRTVCACSDMKRVMIQDMDIRNFLTKYPKCVSYEIKTSSLSSSNVGALCPPKNFDALVREDLVRQEHDRRKKKKNGKRTRTSGIF